MLQRQGSVMESQQKLEFFISCRSLADVDTFSKSDPFCILFVKKGQQWMENNRTELIWDNLNPNFAKTFIIDYFFEVQQHIKFEVHHHISKTSSKLIGLCETTISAIAGAKDSVLVADLVDQGKHTGKIIVRADQVKTCNDDLKMKLSAEAIMDTRFWFWHTTSPFIRLYRLRKDDPHPVLVYETEFTKNQRSTVWKEIAVKSQKICNGDYFMPIKVELWDYRSNGGHVYLGETSFTVDEMKNKPNSKKEFKDKTKNKVVGTLVFNEFKLIEQPSFLDYIAGGIQLNLVLAIDFTASNQNPHHPSSLHYLDPQGKLNQYQQAIVSVGEILINYDYDKMVPVYGFGCKPHLPAINTANTLHCFPINGNIENPEVEGLNGIMQAYQYVLPNVQFDGPTYFAPILNETMKIAAQCRDLCSDNYFIVLILTDGEIHDMKATIDAVIASSHLPISIIIVGVGNADFSNMNILDNDDMSMVDSSGRKAKRDLVQFVPFNEFKGNPELLAKNVLEELPNQLVEYMQLVGRKPNPPKSIIKPKIFKILDINMSQYNYIPPVVNAGDPYQQPQQQFPSQKQPQSAQQQYPYPIQSQYPQQRQNDVNQMGGQYGQYFQAPQQQKGIGTQVLGQGLARGGFLNQHIQQAQYTDQQQQQMLYQKP